MEGGHHTLYFSRNGEKSSVEGVYFGKLFISSMRCLTGAQKRCMRRLSKLITPDIRLNNHVRLHQQCWGIIYLSLEIMIVRELLRSLSQDLCQKVNPFFPSLILKFGVLTRNLRFCTVVTRKQWNRKTTLYLYLSELMPLKSNQFDLKLLKSLIQLTLLTLNKCCVSCSLDFLKS